MQKRIYGLETEYRWWSPLPEENPNDASQVFSGRCLNTIVNYYPGNYAGFLPNGSRFYVDMMKFPELSTPECASVRDAVIWDKAGEKIVFDCLGGFIVIRKRNLGSNGKIQGCHENYLIDRQVLLKDHNPFVSPECLTKQDFDYLANRFVPFLVTRQIFCGAGAIMEFPQIQIGENSSTQCSYRYIISQRAFRIECLISAETLFNRPIINTRNEPLCGGDDKYFRLHLILGDSNLSELSTFLKLGTTGIILRMIEADFLDTTSIALFDPLAALRQIAIDPTCKKRLDLVDQRQLSAIDIQQWYLDRANEFFQRNEASEEEKEVMKYWQEVLDKLRQDPMLLKEEIDWVIKLNALIRYCESRNLSFDSEGARHLDVAYHDLDPENSLYLKLLKRGRIKRLVTEEEVENAIVNPPNTRAKIRSSIILAINDYIDRSPIGRDRNILVNWDSVSVYASTIPPTATSNNIITLSDPFAVENPEIQALVNQLNAVP
ncbi:MAG: proteasome accessory factor PafA2 family protein [Patescibacteria group bacterium]